MSISVTISGGVVCIEDCKKHSGYPDPQFAPTRKARVELFFAVPEGANEQAALDYTTTVANNKVVEILSGQKPETSSAPVTQATPETPRKPKPKDKVPEIPKPVEKTKEDLAREAGLPANDIISTIDETEAPAKGEDDLGDVLGEAAPAPITDAELGKAAQEKNARMKAEQGEKWAPSKIRDLIAEYAGAGKRINDIPADQRPSFLVLLKGLK